ncbi:cytosol aminopeptidase [Nephila pilipes]|uniref:Cytosol aminopeptidase n=1 Tax=Nephila pilipes TaxID=299642 RepID=A0A8X6MNM7_NEPPI|nr:cytosol aminopeptidase [Nephila pilipes]
MDKMREDIGGAACVTGTILAASKLKLKINVKVLIPIGENTPGGKATKPGEVVNAMNGKSTDLDNTDAEEESYSLASVANSVGTVQAQKEKPTAYASAEGTVAERECLSESFGQK